MNWMRETPEYRNAWLKTRQEKSIQFLRERGREWNDIPKYMKEMKNAASPSEDTIKDMKANRVAYYNKWDEEKRKRKADEIERYKKHAKEEAAWDEKRNEKIQIKKENKEARQERIKEIRSNMCCIL